MFTIYCVVVTVVTSLSNTNVSISHSQSADNYEQAERLKSREKKDQIADRHNG